MTRTAEEIQQDIDRATGNAWLNQEERVWGLNAIKEEVEKAEKAAGGTSSGMVPEQLPAQGTMKNSKKKKKRKDDISRMLERTRNSKKAMPATSAEAAKGGRKSKRGRVGEKKVVVTVANGKLLKGGKNAASLKKKLRQPTPDEELASGVAPNTKGKNKKPKKRFNGPLKGGFYPSKKPKGPMAKKAASMAGFHVVGASGSKQGADKVNTSGVSKKKLKKAIQTFRKRKSGMGSSAGMHVVG